MRRFRQLEDDNGSDQFPFDEVEICQEPEFTHESWLSIMRGFNEISQDEVFDLFSILEAEEDQLDFPTIPTNRPLVEEILQGG